MNVITPAKYNYTIFINQRYYDSNEFSQATILYQDKLSSAICGASELCNMGITIHVIDIIDENDPSIELTVKQIGNIPYYIPKGVVRQDFLSGVTPLNLFSTLGVNDEGYISIDFARGSGEVYAKIVGFNEKDRNKEWRQYEFPKTQEGTLKYEFYNKRLIFNSTETSKCDNGCYLLISLKSSAEGKLDEEYCSHPFSIAIVLTPKSSGNEPIVQINPEEYIIGSLSDKNKIKNNQMYQYYQITIPYEAEKVIFDWQSDSAILLVSNDDQKPTLQKNILKGDLMKDTIYELSKYEIKSGGKIAQTNLIIGVYTEDLESIEGTAYSFRVHFSKTLNIYKVNSDKKNLCKPDKIENTDKYRCLYMITMSDLDFIYDLMIYSRSQSSSASTYMYGRFIENQYYDSFNVEELKNNMPNENSPYNTNQSNVDFIFLTLSDIDSHFYVSVISDKPDIIELITSFKTFDVKLSPNPSSVELYAMNNLQLMELNFVTTKPLFINIVSLNGESTLYFKGEEKIAYSLRGRDDRLSLAIPSKAKGESTTLIVEKNSTNQNNIPFLTEKKIELPAVAFYLDYYIRSIELNLDEIYLGKTAEIAYKSSDFPFYYYSKLSNTQESINAFFILHDIEYSSKNNKFSSEDIDIRGTVVSQKTIYLVKVNDESKPNLENSPILGIYDPALQVGQVYFSPSQLQTNLNNPTIYLSLEKTAKNYKVERIRIELAAVQENTDVPVTEKLYQYGKINDYNAVNSYRLKVDNSTGFMRIQFSSNSENVNYAIAKTKNTKKNMALTGVESKEIRGKKFITFDKPKDTQYIYFNVFLKEDNNSASIASNNYVFKYINSDSKSKFFEYNIVDNDSTLSYEKNKDSNKYTVTFKKIKSQGQSGIDVIYSLKAVKFNNYKNEKFKTIALTESSSNVTQVKNPSTRDNKITLEIEAENENEIGFLQVIAQIRQGPITEYEAYDPITFDKKDSGSSDKSKLIIILVISGVLLLIVIALVIIILAFNSKNKDLMEQVNKISFIKSGAKPNDDVNLLLDNQNELE